MCFKILQLKYNWVIVQIHRYHKFWEWNYILDIFSIRTTFMSSALCTFIYLCQAYIQTANIWHSLSMLFFYYNHHWSARDGFWFFSSLWDTIKNHHAEAVNQEKNVKVVRTHCSLVRVGVHHPSCFLAGLMGTGLLWAEQTLSRQETSSSSCFMHACRLIPASFLVAYQLQQHYFLPESPMTAATNLFPYDTLSCTFVLISTCFVVSSYP